jgi:hypothetical protein
LHGLRNGGSKFNDAMDNLTNEMTYVHHLLPRKTATATVYRGSDEIEMTASVCPWKSTALAGN